MNVNINIPGLNPSGDVGLRISYLNNILIQWQNIGFVDSYDFSQTTNNLLGQMVAFLLNDVDSPDAKTLYDINIDTIELKKSQAYEQWEQSILNIYLNPGKFNIV